MATEKSNQAINISVEVGQDEEDKLSLVELDSKISRLQGYLSRLRKKIAKTQGEIKQEIEGPEKEKKLTQLGMEALNIQQKESLDA